MQTLFGGGGEEKSNGFAASSSLAAPLFRENGGGDALQNASAVVHTATNGDGISKRDLIVAPTKTVDDNGLMSSGYLPPLITPISDGLSPLGRRDSTENGSLAVKSDSFCSETAEIYSEPPSATENFTATVSDGLPTMCSDLLPNNGEATVTTKKSGGGRDKSEENTNTGRSC